MMTKLTPLVLIFLCFPIMGANFGPWPQAYLLGEGLLSCENENQCKIPRVDDISTLKSDWLAFEEVRIQHIESLKVETRKILDQALTIAQAELEAFDESEYGDHLMTAINKTDKELALLNGGELDLWVSQSSPVFEFLLELESLIEFHREKPLKKKEYFQWLNERRSILLKIKKYTDKFFPKSVSLEENIELLLTVRLPLVTGIEFKGCDKGIIKKVAALLGDFTFYSLSGELSLIGDREVVQNFFLSSVQDKKAIVNCKKKKTFSPLKIDTKRGRSFTVYYKIENGVFKVPDLSPIKRLRPSRP